uniref:Ig-like domain-containing protein n=1 Tax=Apteryx owenii TaxID=8824 RepID=A0A8B9S6B2_APTOW
MRWRSIQQRFVGAWRASTSPCVVTALSPAPTGRSCWIKMPLPLLCPQGPGPYLSLSPSHEVALGDKVTLQCHTPRQGGRAILHKEGVRHPLRYQDRVQGAAEFPITAVRREDAGRYWCQYEMEGEPPEKSEHVELVLRVFKGPHEADFVVLGTHFTILCQGGHGATFLLHREGSSAPIQRQAPGGHMALFSIPHVSWADSGTYSCSYRPQGEMFVSSYPSIFLELECWSTEGWHQACRGQSGEGTWRARKGNWILRDLHGAKPPSPLSRSDTPRFSVPSDFTLGNTVRLGLGAGLLILLMLLVAEALHSWRRKGQGPMGLGGCTCPAPLCLDPASLPFASPLNLLLLPVVVPGSCTLGTKEGLGLPQLGMGAQRQTRGLWGKGWRARGAGWRNCDLWNTYSPEHR